MKIFINFKQKNHMRIKVDNIVIEFDVINVSITNRNQNNLFKNNIRRTLKYYLDKAIINNKNRLHKYAPSLKDKYSADLNSKLGEFLFKLKDESNNDYKLFLNRYGDELYCNYNITKYSNDKGIYCYIVDDKIVYIGRSKQTFGKRFKDYGKITPYNCLIDGQATNCNINSRVNNLDSLMVGFYVMNNSTDKEIEILEKIIIKALNNDYILWNIQIN